MYADGVTVQKLSTGLLRLSNKRIIVGTGDLFDASHLLTCEKNEEVFTTYYSALNTNH